MPVEKNKRNEKIVIFYGNLSIRILRTTPSIAIYNNLRGLTIFNNRSIASNIAIIISSSFLGAGLKKIIYSPDSKKFMNPQIIQCYIRRNILIFRMGTGMNNTVHVQIKIVKFDSIRIWGGRINLLYSTIDIF